MNDLDEVDAEILRLLVEEGRRPYSDIAESVELSAPAVRDRIDRLREAGIIRRFTVDLDRSKLREGVPVLVGLEVDPDVVGEVRDDLAETPGVEHVFVAAEPRVFLQASVPGGEVRPFLDEAIGLEGIEGIDVTLLTEATWTPGIHGAEFALSCAECGNTVTAEGESATIDGDRYHFCCPSCREKFEAHYAEIREGA